MQRRWAKAILMVSLVVFIVLVGWQSPVEASNRYQLPTGSIPTVTSTASGPMVVVVPGNEPLANLRSGPNTLYEQVGILLVGQRAPALGRSPGGDWILVEYTGAPGGKAWVYAPLVEVQPSTQLPIVEPPPTPTPLVTATIDPTLAARFVITTEPTRLPTFTAPPPLVIPTFTADTTPTIGGIPMGFVILGLAAIGIFFGVVAFAQGR